MKNLDILLYEWKHFTRNPFKVVALLLFTVAGVYGLHNGAKLYREQTSEIERIRENSREQRQEYIAYYEEGKSGPDERPWIDLTTPRWAIWYSNTYHFKMPSPALVYSIGQAEQYGFHKRITYMASPYDADMTKEIANPERLQIGTLDFSFAVLFLLPLLLLVLVYDLQSSESEQGFLPLIEVQTTSKNTWLLSRMAFYIGFAFLVIVALAFYGAFLTDVLTTARGAFFQIVVHSLFYLLLWSVMYFFILRTGKSILGNTLQMVGVWLLFAFIIPASVHQWMSLSKPANLMTDFIDAQREDREQLFEQPDSVIQAQLYRLFPEIVDSPVARDSAKSYKAMNESGSALVNELKKKSIAPIEAENQEKNELIQNTYWFNPVTLFQNKFNAISQTHYTDYQQFRNDIQALVDQQITSLVLDTWHAVKVDKAKYLEYNKSLATSDIDHSTR